MNKKTEKALGVVIVNDMEGISGIDDWHQIFAGCKECELPYPEGYGFLLHRANRQSGSQPSRRHDGNASASTFSLADAQEYTGVSKEGSGRPNPTLVNKKRVDKKNKHVGFHPQPEGWGLPPDRAKWAENRINKWLS